MIDRQSYKINGYVLLKGLFHAQEIDHIREEAKEIFISQMRRYGILGSGEISEREFEQGMFELFDTDLWAFINCGKHAQHLISLHRLALDDRILARLKDLGLEFPNISTPPVI